MKTASILALLTCGFIFGSLFHQAALGAPKSKPSAPITVPAPPNASPWRAVWQTDDGRQWCPVPVTVLSWQLCP